MLEPSFNQSKLFNDSEDFEAFLLILKRNQKIGQNYVVLPTIPKKLHYRLIQENFIIKRDKITIKKFFFFKKSVLYYFIKPAE